MASTISLHSFIGGGNGFGSRPRIKAKSTWKRRPSSVRRRLSRCLENTKKNAITGKPVFACVVSLLTVDIDDFMCKEEEDVQNKLSARIEHYNKMSLS